MCPGVSCTAWPLPVRDDLAESVRRAIGLGQAADRDIHRPVRVLSPARRRGPDGAWGSPLDADRRASAPCSCRPCTHWPWPAWRNTPTTRRIRWAGCAGRPTSSATTTFGTVARSREGDRTSTPSTPSGHGHRTRRTPVFGRRSGVGDVHPCGRGVELLGVVPTVRPVRSSARAVRPVLRGGCSDRRRPRGGLGAPIGRRRRRVLPSCASRALRDRTGPPGARLVASRSAAAPQRAGRVQRALRRGGKHVA